VKTSLLARGLVLCVCGLVLYRGARMAVADAAVATCLACAMRIEPANESYVARHAMARDQAGDTSEDVDAELHRAVAMNPRDSAVLRSLGVRAELSGDPAQAEQYLQRAVAVDHSFQPQWALANFYLRVGRMDRFWPAIHYTLGIIEPKSSDPRVVAPEPVFDLCWNVTSDSEKILAQAPQSKGLLLAYVRYLMRTGRGDAAVEALPRVLASPSAPSDLPILTDLCDFLVRENRTAQAILVWNHLVGHGLIRSTRLDPERAQSVENPAFTFPLVDRAFGWKLPRDEKIIVTTGDHFVAFEMSGTGPEHVELLSKVVPVLPERNYRLRWQVDASRLETHGRKDTGLRMHLWGSGGELSPACSPFLSGAVHSCSFAVPAGLSQLRLALRYDRPLGAVTPEGVLRLENVSLEFLP